jgi:hypothetical protein
MVLREDSAWKETTGMPHPDTYQDIVFLCGGSIAVLLCSRGRATHHQFIGEIDWMDISRHTSCADIVS